MKPSVFAASTLTSNEPPALSDATWRFLAEGDSWFTIGGLNLPNNANVLFALDLCVSTAIVSCAYPGDTLRHMADAASDPNFDAMLRRPGFARWWEAILISAGGNDLIDAAQHRAVHGDGSAAALDERVLLTPAEAAVVNPGVSGPERFVSQPGWALLARDLLQSYTALVARRDDGINAGRPIFVHTYHVPVVRPSGTVGSPHGWLFAAFETYGIAPADQQGLGDLLFNKLRALLLSLDMDSGSAAALPQVHVFDSATLAALTPAQANATGVSGDWVNEIHPNRAGYAKIGAVFGPWIDTVMQRYA